MSTPSSTSPARAHARRAWRSAATLARVALWLAGGTITLALLAWLTLHWAILPHIDRWRPLIEREASQVLGVQVAIGAIEARTGGWAPTLELRDVQLHDAAGRPGLQVQRVVASISARSLLSSLVRQEIRLAQLVIDGASLDARRDTAGRWFVAGLELGGLDAADDTAAADWLFSQPEIAIRGATLRWTDERRAAPPLALSAVDIVIRNSLRRHDLRLDATPPAAWGERFALRAELTQALLARAGDWRHWNGQAYIDAPRADASELRQYVDLPFELSQGVGAVRAWLDVHEGTVASATLDLALSAVALRLAPSLEPLVVEELHGRLAGQTSAAGGSLALRGFAFVTGGGVRWPAGDLTLNWTRGADGNLAGGTFSAERLDLALVADTASRLPLGGPVRRLLAETQPRGLAHSVSATWEGPLDALARYRVSARLTEVALAAKHAPDDDAIGRPGLSNANIDLSATEGGGEATLTMKDGAIDLPGVFADPVIPLDELGARLSWRIDRKAAGLPALQVQVRDARLANADAEGRLNATWSTGPGEGLARGGRLPGRLELDATLSRGVASRAARYLPLGLSEGTRRYVQRAVRGGTLTRATFRIRGDLWDFPMFAGRPGEFRVAIAAEDLTLAYVPSIGAGESAEAAYASPWPPMTQLSGELVVDRSTLEFRKAKAHVLGVELTSLQGGIRNLADKPVLELRTQARGPVADMLRYVDTTPVGGWIQGALREANAGGNGELALSLALPLQDLAQTTVSGSLMLDDSDLRLRPTLPLLGAARGRVNFTERGFSVANASAHLLGGEATLAGGSQPDGSMRFTLQGRASVEGLRNAPELGLPPRLDGVLSGQANYRFAFGIVKGLPEFELSSDLVGIAASLPAPLAKRADVALPLRVQSTPVGGSPLDSLTVELGPVLRAQFTRDLSGATPRVLRGGIGVFAPAPTPANGVAAVARLESLDADAWSSAAGRLFAPATAPGVAVDASSRGYLPTTVALEAGSLTIDGKHLEKVAAGLSELEGEWRANVDATQLSGYLAYRPPGAGEGQPGRVYARLARLALPKGDADDVAELLDRQPASVPTLDIVIDDLELRGKHVGRMEVQAVNRTAPERQWELSKLRLSMPEAQLNASGRWVVSPSAPRGPGPARRQAEFGFKLDIEDSGALLQRLGSVESIRGGKGRVEGRVAWQGSPLQPDFASMVGSFDVDIEQGQFLQPQSGAARLLGVLSLQSLARRLTLDFRDLFLDGFVFDSVTGEVKIDQGVASTRNLLMRGAQAVVLLEGSADARRETQNLRVFVIPEINAGAISLAYAVVNPVVGLGTFVAQLFLREPLIQASTREFRITGSWSDPLVEPVERPAGQAVPRVAPAASVPLAPASTTPQSP